MDGLYEMTGSPLPVVVGGRTFLLGALTAADHGLIEQRILTERRKPADALAEILPALNSEQQRMLLEIAWRDEVRGPRVPHAEVRQWLLTERGQIFRIWLMLKHHQEVTIEEAGAIYRQALSEIGQKSMQEAAEHSGAELGNSSAPAPAGAAESQSNASPGGQSSENSAKTTDGRQRKSAK